MFDIVGGDMLEKSYVYFNVYCLRIHPCIIYDSRMDFGMRLFLHIQTSAVIIFLSLLLCLVLFTGKTMI